LSATPVIITLDGPVGVGKSSVAQALSRKLGFTHIDTGAMYRAVTLIALERKIRPDDHKALADLAASLKIEIKIGEQENRVWVDGREVTRLIRAQEISRATSNVADCIGVRKVLVKHQRELGNRQNSVLEGRDQGTEVFPDASIKFYLDASLEERTRRRGDQLQQNGKRVAAATLRSAIQERDKRDRSRPYGPLRVAPDAIVVDTTGISEPEVVELLFELTKSELV